MTPHGGRRRSDNDPARADQEEDRHQHFFAAATYSFGGAKRLIGESAFRHELMAIGVIAVLFALVGATFFQYVAMGILFLLMIAFEALNTAIEEIVDRVSPEISDMGRNAKDLGSLACLCLIVANGVYAAYVVIYTPLMAG